MVSTKKREIRSGDYVTITAGRFAGESAVVNWPRGKLIEVVVYGDCDQPELVWVRRANVRVER